MKGRQKIRESKKYGAFALSSYGMRRVHNFSKSYFYKYTFPNIILSPIRRHLLLLYYKRLPSNLYLSGDQRRAISISSARFKKITKLMYLFSFRLRKHTCSILSSIQTVPYLAESTPFAF